MGSFFLIHPAGICFTTILQIVTPISILKNVIFCSSLQYRSSKIIPSFFVDKASCTRQFENELSLHSLASLFPIKEGIFRKPTRPSLPLRKAPPLISVFSPQARRRKPPYSVLFMPHLSLPCGRVLNPHPSPRPFQKGQGCNRPPVLRTATL